MLITLFVVHTINLRGIAIAEQDHRSIKRITNPMLGFKSFRSAETTLAGIELHHMLRKKQHVNTANQSIVVLRSFMR